MKLVHLGFGVCLLACGQVPPIGSGGSGGQTGALPPLGEPQCATTPPDAVWTESTPMVGSNGANYDHATCRHTFIVDADVTTTPRRLTATTSVLPLPSASACSEAWIYVSLWRQQGETFIKGVERVAPATFGPLPGLADVCHAHLDTDIIEEAGRYRVLSAAGYSGGYFDVTVRGAF